MSLSDQMKLAAGKPFGGKQATPFGKSGRSSRHTSSKRSSKHKKASLSGQLKIAGLGSIAGSAIGGGIGLHALGEFLKKNPHMLKAIGLEAEHIPKGLGGLGAVMGGGADVLLHHREREGA